ncbi:MAG: nucleotidyltransferase [Candidatus Sericytochromatia bacterium]|nr:nucleotidyltransferase [Candidatus Tanganyikabacteria bacterium]
MAPPGRLLGELLPALGDLARWLSATSYPGAVIGGIAAGLQGRPRVTKDIDATVIATIEDAPAILAELREFGFEPRVDDPVAFAGDTGVLLLVHSDSSVEVDLTLAALPFEIDMVEGARTLVVAGTTLRVAAPEDLLVMKSLARRPVDVVDIEGLLDANPALDLDRVRLQLRSFAEVLEAPEIVADFEAILARRK